MLNRAIGFFVEFFEMRIMKETILTPLFLVLLTFSCLNCTQVRYEPEKVVKYEIKQIVSDNLPPKIVVVKPETDLTRGISVFKKQRKLLLEGFVFDESGIESFTINGRSISLNHEGKFTYFIPNISSLDRIELTAIDNKNNKNQRILKLNINYSSKIERPISQKITMSKRSELWILSIGISKYKKSELNLKYADHDAIKIANFFFELKGGTFNDVHPKIITNSKATRGRILTEMTSHLGKAGPNDVILIFLAGHGIKNVQTGSYYFLPYDADSRNLIFEGLKWSDFDEVIKILSNNVNKLILILDTCHAGAINISSRGIIPGEDLAEKIATSSGLYILSASKAGEQSIESEHFKLDNESKGHGAFSYAILKGLKGDANYDKNSYLTVSELFSFVANKVPVLTNGRQHPYSKFEGTDLPLVFYNP